MALAIALMISFHESPLASSNFIGHITYTLKTVSNPSADQSDAYTKIRSVMDSALWYYNSYTTITKKITVEYNTSVQTADGSFSGNIRFGKNRQYMKGCTAMHEIAHTTGVGTTTQWGKLISNGKYTGINANNKLREITGDSKATLNGDSQHFWPYGLNYDSEVKSKDDLINHCLIVNAIQMDLFPSIAFTHAAQHVRDNFSISLISGNTLSYTLPSPCFVKLGVYTLSGQKIFDFEQARMGQGGHTIKLTTNVLSHGFYVYRFQAGPHRESRSFTISK